MKYFVGTALGKKTSTVLGNALGTAWGGAAFFFLLYSCRECYASAPIVYNVFTFPVERIFEFHSCVNLWPNTSPLSDPILPLLGSFEAAVCLYRLPVQPVNTYTLEQYLDYMMIDTVKMTEGCG